MSFTFELLIVVALTLLNGVFAAAEIAIISVRATRVAELATEGTRGAYLARLRGNPERFLATVQIGITVVGAAAAAFGGATWAEQIGEILVETGLPEDTAENVALVIVVVSVSFLSLVLGELVPKSLALKWAERYALLVARPLFLLGRVAAPVVWILTASSNVVLRLFGDRTSFVESAISRDELLGVIDRAGDAGEVSQRAADIASRAIELDELHVASVMVPRGAVVAIDEGASTEELARLLDTTDEERFPVRRDREDLVGYVTTRDIARLLGGLGGGSLHALVRPVHVVPETALALHVLDQLQAKRIPIAAVVDESGGLEGIVDLDDLAEEIVGTMLVGPSRDEAAITRAADGSAVVPGTMRVHVANRKLGLELPTSSQWSTIGGLLLARLGAMPSVGATVELEGRVRLEVVEASARRVQRVLVRPPAPESAASADDLGDDRDD